jgi:dTDP-4-dehydrorhamnose 3,5-epimerase
MDDTKFVIIGSKGQLGTALREKYPHARAVDADELDITNRDAVQAFNWSEVTTILNAAAYTNVDGAETAEGRVMAWSVNALGPRNLAELAIKQNMTLVHISTDYVFDGTHKSHIEGESFSPLSVYGQSKAAGDLLVSLVPKHYILRTTWVIGEGKNFVRTMLDLGQKGVAPTVVSDQFGRLTFTGELVRVIDHLLQTTPTYGTYNATNDGHPASWADIARQIFKLGGFNQQVADTITAEYFATKTGVAPRPLNSVMDLSKLKVTGFTPRDWQEDLKTYLKKELN